VIWNYFGFHADKFGFADRSTRKFCVNSENGNILIQNNYLKSISNTNTKYYTRINLLVA